MKNYILKFKKFKFFFVILIFTFYILNLPTPTYAACPSPGPSGVSIKDCFAFGDIQSLGDATSKLVMPVFSIATATVVIYFLMGAFKYLKAGGNKEEVEGARQMITHAIIGFMILMLAFFVLQFILSSLFDTKFSIIKT